MGCDCGGMKSCAMDWMVKKWRPPGGDGRWSVMMWRWCVKCAHGHLVRYEAKCSTVGTGHGSRWNDRHKAAPSTVGEEHRKHSPWDPRYILQTYLKIWEDTWINRPDLATIWFQNGDIKHPRPFPTYYSDPQNFVVLPFFFRLRAVLILSHRPKYIKTCINALNCLVTATALRSNLTPP